MDATHDINDLPWMNAFEAGKFLGLPTENVLGGWEDGTLPAPRCSFPLRWHEDDLLPVWERMQGTER